MKRFYALLLVALPACFLHAQSNPAPAAAPHAPAAPARERIAQCLERMAGLGAAPAIEQVESVSLAKEFPFLGAQAGDDQGWRVRLAMTKLPWPAKLPGQPDTYRRRVTVFLDAGAERILAITARAEDPAADPAPAAVPATADRVLLTRGTGFGNLGAFSKVSPKLTLMDTLMRVCGGGVGYPPAARDIDAYHLQYGESGRPERSVWLVDLHGLPEMPISVPFGVRTKPSGKRFSHAWMMIDAATGEFLYPMSSETPDGRFPARE